MRARLVLAVLLGLFQSCGSDSAAPDGRLYRIRSDLDPSVSFRILLKSSASIEEAERLLRSGETRWVVGRLRRGDGGFNAPWSWHFDPDDPADISFAEVTIEECQATPGYVEEHLDAWLRRETPSCLSGRVWERLD
jgi:hypothetical protein